MAIITSNYNVIAAILGNWRQESTVNPGIWEGLTESTFDHEYQYDGIGGYGLGQWTNIGTPHGRLWNLYQYAQSKSVIVSDGGIQIDFFVEENYWIPDNPSKLKYKSLTEFLNSTSNSLADLTYDFCSQWEGVPDNQTEKRLEYANTALGNILLHYNDSPTKYSWIKGNRYLNADEIFNNTMAVFFYFTDNKPPDPPKPPTPAKKKKGMPLWMMLKWN